MIKTLQEIQSSIASGEITAITLDTSIVDAQQKNLEHGLLRRLSQFKGSDTKVLLPDVVLREIESHLLNDAEETLTAVRRANSLISRRWQHASAGPFAEATNNVLSVTAASVVKSRLEAFCAASDVVTIKAEMYVKTGDVIRRYFTSKPPFDTKESKKHEFPDAFALLTLEAWAAQNNTHVLVVTQDGDWKSYCAESECLIALDNLSIVLGCFQRETARYACQRMLELYEEGDPLDLKAKLLDEVRNRWYDIIDININAYSQFQYTGEGLEIEFADLTIETNDKSIIVPVEYGDDHVVASLQVRASAEITCHFLFDKWDSIDCEYTPMGTGFAIRKEELCLSALVTLEGDLPNKMKVVEIEILPESFYLEFGEIEPSWMTHPDNH
jgi:hypothetical protein